MAILDNIRAGLDRGELFVEYLPTMDLASGGCVGAEALVRWRRGEVILTASEFMPLVEDTPLSGTLTYWVIDTVAAELAQWLGANPDAQIGINVPAEILGRGGLEYAARRSGLNARVGQIVLEITEHGVPDRLGLTALYVSGRRTPVADLQSGTNLKFYIAEDRLAAQFPEEETATTTQHVIVPIVVREAEPSRNEHLAAALPATGSQLPLLAVCGFMALGLGGLLTLRRKR